MDAREKLLPFDEALTTVITVLGVIIACSIILYAMARRGVRGVKPPKEKEKKEEEPKFLPFKIVKTVSTEEAQRAREELRILDLEREILSDAIRKLYEAHAEGKITEEEREKLAQGYKARIMAVKDAISKDEALVALYELEAMQEDLIKLFSERFDEIGSKIEELRARIEMKPIKEITITPTEAVSKPSEEEGKKEEAPEKKEEKAPKKRKKLFAKQGPSSMSEAEKRIEEIRAEVEKVLERLGQMEIET